MRVFNYLDLNWRKDALYCGKRKITALVQDEKYSTMWRIRLPDGTLSDMVNKTRAKDVATLLALRFLNNMQETPNHSP